MKKIVLFVVLSIFTIVPSITFGVATKTLITNSTQPTDSVKGVSVERVYSLLTDAGYKEPGVYVSHEKGIGAGYGFYLKFLNLNREKKKIKFSYDFGNYKISFKVNTKCSVEILIADTKENYIINFDNE